MKLYLDTSGYIHFDVYASGASVLSMVSASPINTSTWVRVTVFEANNRFRMYTTTQLVKDSSYTHVLQASATSSARLAAYTQNVVLGAFYNGSDYSSFFNGNMAVFATDKYLWRGAMAAWHMIASQGMVTSSLSHTEGAGNSRGLFIPIFESLTEFNGGTNTLTSPVRAMTAKQMTTWLKSNGRAITDARGGTDRWRYDIPKRTVDIDDLRINSPAIYGGTDLGITGGDRVGVPIRDSAHPTIGSREKYQKVF